MTSSGPTSKRNISHLTPAEIRKIAREAHLKCYSAVAADFNITRTTAKNIVRLHKEATLS